MLQEWVLMRRGKDLQSKCQKEVSAREAELRMIQRGKYGATEILQVWGVHGQPNSYPMVNEQFAI